MLHSVKKNVTIIFFHKSIINMKIQYLNTYSMLGFLIFYIIETYFDISFLSRHIILYSILLSDIIYSFSYFNIRKLKSIYFYLSIHIFFRRGHPGSAGFHCILEPLTLHMCHGSLTALQLLTISVLSVWFLCNG